MGNPLIFQRHDFGTFLTKFIESHTCLVVVEHRLELMQIIDAEILGLSEGKLVNGISL